MTLLETFLHGLAFGSYTRLRRLRLVPCPDSASYHRRFRKTLGKNLALVRDLIKTKPECESDYLSSSFSNSKKLFLSGHVETLIDCQSMRDESFWKNFLATRQTFVKVSGVILRSPFCHGNVKLTTTILGGLEQVRRNF